MPHCPYYLAVTVLTSAGIMECAHDVSDKSSILIKIDYSRGDRLAYLTPFNYVLCLVLVIPNKMCPLCL